MSTLKINNIQIGQSATAANNFSLAVPAVPNGTIKLSRGNASATLSDVLNVSATGQVDLFGGLSSSNIQIGQNATATNNFFFSTPSTGALKLARGNIGSGTQDLMTVDSNGKVDFPAGLTAFLGTNQSLSASGYQKLPGGLIVQWGTTGTVPNDGGVTVTFPTPFPTACFVVIPTVVSSNTNVDNFAMVISKSTTTTVLGRGWVGGSTLGENNPMMWIAIGM